MVKSTTNTSTSITPSVATNKSNRKWKSSRKPVSSLVSQPFDKGTAENIKQTQRSQKELVKKLQKQVNERLEVKRQKEIRAIKQKRQAKQEKLWQEKQFERLKQGAKKSNGKNKRVTGKDHKLAKSVHAMGKIVV
eukprot:CAMPEP_0117449862 /NCGR_PEP_ID=MMETSP0759-20121206/8164_1 /TAXON_ID=63605 /ORGANISM="Percolomonas cosmopolitus, Strain WS" /LENGTH=134 /DNA_ID=CAMNT_0005242351 /DNA_START=30 /DNA_END=434 /DNA_ORIENTATION=+